MLKTLHGRLLLVLLALLIPLGALYVVVTLTTSQRYYQEITQKLNAGVAASIAADQPNLMVDNTVDTDKFDQLAKSLAMVNPGVEIYILLDTGEIIGSSVAMEALERKTVATEPLEAFLSSGEAFPILGTNPRRASGRKIFSVAPIADNEGYLYVLLADTTSDSVIRSAQNSTALRLGLWGGGIVLLLVLGVGTLAFTLLTRRLRRLGAAMTQFRQADFVLEAPSLEKPTTINDEIDELQLVFTEMSERISAQVQSLRQVDTLRRELITNISHDLRTPLTALQGYLETLERKETSLSNEERRYLEGARKHATRLGRLISDLFDLSRLDAAAIEARLEAFPLHELAYDVVQKFQLAANTKGVDLDVTMHEPLPFVSADIGLIERVLTNLVENALRHTSAGGQICIKLKPSENAVLTEIADTGEGIGPEALEHVFDRFYRASSQDTGGTGLGLAISKRILELHGSEIKVRSNVGEGTEFRFALPRA